MPDFLYKNAPLIEVIAEVRWAVVPLNTIPGGGVDPHFASASEAFLKLAQENGYRQVERLVPSGIPIEMIAGQPVYRLRTAPNVWPLFQIGPGLFTCNIVPTYNGWADFRGTLFKGISWLWKSFPLPPEFIKFAGLELRYIDGFTKTHGMTEPSAFLKEDLGIGFGLRGLPKQADGGQTEVAIEAKFSLPGLQDSSFILRVNPGATSDQPALIAEFRVARSGDFNLKVSEMESWMDEAHAFVRQTFDMLASDRLKERMGPRVELG